MAKSSGGKHDGGGSHGKKYDANKEAAKQPWRTKDGQGPKQDSKHQQRDPKKR